MPTIKEVSGFIENIAPQELAEDWDNVGLLVESDAKTDKILVCLDITNEVVIEAKNLGCGLIVSHHPVIFSPIRSLTMQSPVFLLAENKISAICSHTNLDAACGGVNDVLAEVLGIQNCVSFGGLGRIGELAEVSSGYEVGSLCKERLHTYVQLADSGKPIRKVAVVGGVGGSYWKEAKEAGADCLVTGEASHHNALDALAEDFTLVVAGHYATEWPVTKYLQSQLENQFSDTKVYISETNKAPFSIL